MSPASGVQQESRPAQAKMLQFRTLQIAHEPARPAAQPSRPPQTRLSHELLRATDVAVAITALVIVVAATNSDHFVKGIDDFLFVRITLQNLALFAVLTLLWPVVLASFGLYDRTLATNWKKEVLLLISACTVGTLATLPFLLTSGGGFRLRTLLAYWISVVTVTLLIRFLIRAPSVHTGVTAPHHTLIVGSGPRALKLYQRLMSEEQPQHEVVGFVDSSAGMLEALGHKPLGTLDELESILMHRVVDQVLIALPIKSCYAEIQDTIDICERVGVEACYLADFFKHSLAKPRYENGSDVPLVSLKVAPDDLRLIVKRGFDIVGAAIGLVFLAPLLLVLAAIIKLTSAGPVFFAQKRYGYNRRIFRMYKFRTMVAGAEALQASLEHLNEVPGPVFKIKDDPRVTPVGRFLRRTSLDELPQLFNVLKGDMSLVGPRPLPVRDVENFSEAWLMRRFSVVPGCTGLWQISGRSDLGFDDWMTLDLRYIDQWSLGLDTKILLQTLPAILRGTGAS